MLEGRGPVPERLGDIQAALLAARAARVRPGLDDKRLTSWNALMISALAQAGAALERSDYVSAAVACAEFVLGDMRDPDGRLLRTWKDGRAHIDAYLEDHAYLLEALLTLYEATFDARWYAEARAMADTMIERFADEEHGGFFTTAADQHQGFARQKDLDDSPIPSGGAAAAFGLLRLARVTGEFDYERRALDVLRVRAAIVGEHPHGFGHTLSGAGLLPGAGARGGDRRRGDGDERARRRWRGSCAARTGPTWCWPAAGAPRRARSRWAAAGGPRPRGRARRGVRVRALRLPGAGDRPRGAGRRSDALATGRGCLQNKPAYDASDDTRPPARRRATHRGLQHRQVALELPGRDLDAVVVPLLALDLDVAVEHVLAEGAQDEL